MWEDSPWAGLSVRASHALTASGAGSLEDVARLGWMFFARRGNCGRKTIGEIRFLLACNGFVFADESAEDLDSRIESVRAHVARYRSIVADGSTKIAALEAAVNKLLEQKEKNPL